MNARGLSIKCPFVVRPKPKFDCPHHIYVSGPAGPDSDRVLDLATTLSGNALTRAFLPLPKDTPQAFFVSSEQDFAAAACIRMLNFGRCPGPHYAWTLTVLQAQKHAVTTNLVPFLMIGADVKWMAKTGVMLEVFQTSPRPLVVVGEKDCVVPSWMTRVDDVNFTALASDLSTMSTAEFGDTVLRSWMRDEWKPL